MSQEKLFEVLTYLLRIDIKIGEFLQAIGAIQERVYKYTSTF